MFAILVWLVVVVAVVGLCVAAATGDRKQAAALAAIDRSTVVPFARRAA